MRRALVSCLSAVTACAGFVAAASAQTQSPSPPAAQGQPAPAPVTPYKPVTVTLPAPMNDPAFETFRKNLTEAAKKKDRAALTRLVVAKGFFWEGEDGDKADKKKSAGDNLAAVFGLNAKDSPGWDLLAAYAADPTAAASPERKGVVCTPADPAFDDKELEELARATQTDPAEWGYPLTAGIEVHSSPQANSPVLEKLGLHLVRVLPEAGPGDGAQNQMPMLRLALPSGKAGYVAADSIAPLGNDQICYLKEADGWKIAGFIGAGPN